MMRPLAKALWLVAAVVWAVACLFAAILFILLAAVVH